MPTWDADTYLKFARERTQPSVDLAARVELSAPRRIVDLGCGPGNSTAVVARRWPDAAVEGVDTSPDMLATARKDHPRWLWRQADIAAWRAETPVDLVFSNAAFQWVPDHAILLPRLFAQVVPGGALAFQVPANYHHGAHSIIREVAASPAWRESFPNGAREWQAQTASFYYDVLAPIARRLDLWETSYIHVLDGPEGVTEWYRGTGLRPWLDLLPDEASRTRFLADVTARFAEAYPRQADGRVLFPFLRLFAVAYA